jgi:two-component system LytT family sensor kinase
MKYHLVSDQFYRKLSFWTERYKLHHVAFWVLSAIVGAWIFRNSETPFQAALKMMLILSVHMVVAYVNLYLLIPRFLRRQQYLTYASGLLLTLGSATFPMAILVHTILNDQDLKSLVWSTFFLVVIALSLLFTVAVSMAIKLVKDWYQEQRNRQDLEQLQLHTELKFLKTQINPHFLFNSLNNIYGLTLLKSDKASEAIVKLSGILRYLLHESSKSEVSLELELEQMENYFELEILRLGANVQASIHLQRPKNSWKIEPMLMMTLLENAFKHGSKEVGTSYVNCEGQETSTGYSLLITNSMTHQPPKNEDSSGIGLLNLQKRLELSYHNAHRYSVTKTAEEYIVELSLNLNTA